MRSKSKIIPAFPLTKIYLIMVIEKATLFGLKQNLSWRRGEILPYPINRELWQDYVRQCKSVKGDRTKSFKSIAPIRQHEITSTEDSVAVTPLPQLRISGGNLVRHPLLEANKKARAGRQPVSCFWLAERRGFEPPIRFRIHAFQACTLDHSDTSP